MKIYLLAFILFLGTSCKSQNDSGVRIIDLETMKTEVVGKDVQLVDVRTEKEYQAGHIDDAINIDVLQMNSFVKEVERLDKAKPIYLYCKIGGRSKQASKKLKELGFKTIYDFSGGYTEWSNQ